MRVDRWPVVWCVLLGCGPGAVGDDATSTGSDTTSATSSTGTDSTTSETDSESDGGDDSDDYDGEPSLAVWVMRTNNLPNSLHSTHIIDLGAAHPPATKELLFDDHWSVLASWGDTAVLSNGEDQLMYADFSTSPPSTSTESLPAGTRYVGRRALPGGEALILHTFSPTGIEQLWRFDVEPAGPPPGPPMLLAEFPDGVSVVLQWTNRPPPISSDQRTIAIAGWRSDENQQSTDTSVFVIKLDAPAPVFELPLTSLGATVDHLASDLLIDDDGDELLLRVHLNGTDPDAKAYFVGVNSGAPAVEVLPGLPCARLLRIDDHTVLYSEVDGLAPWVVSIEPDGPGTAEPVDSDGLPVYFPQVVHDGARMLFKDDDFDADPASLYSLELVPPFAGAHAVAGPVLGQDGVHAVMPSETDDSLMLLRYQRGEADYRYDLLRWANAALVEQRFIADSLDTHLTGAWLHAGGHVHVWTQQPGGDQVWSLHYDDPQATSMARTPVVDSGVIMTLVAEPSGRHLVYRTNAKNYLVDITAPNVAIPLEPEDFEADNLMQPL